MMRETKNSALKFYTFIENKYLDKDHRYQLLNLTRLTEIFSDNVSSKNLNREHYDKSFVFFINNFYKKNKITLKELSFLFSSHLHNAYYYHLINEKNLLNLDEIKKLDYFISQKNKLSFYYLIKTNIEIERFHLLALSFKLKFLDSTDENNFFISKEDVMMSDSNSSKYLLSIRTEFSKYKKYIIDNNFIDIINIHVFYNFLDMYFYDNVSLFDWEDEAIALYSEKKIINISNYSIFNYLKKYDKSITHFSKNIDMEIKNEYYPIYEFYFNNLSNYMSGKYYEDCLSFSFFYKHHSVETFISSFNNDFDYFYSHSLDDGYLHYFKNRLKELCNFFSHSQFIRSFKSSENTNAYVDFFNYFFQDIKFLKKIFLLKDSDFLNAFDKIFDNKYFYNFIYDIYLKSTTIDIKAFSNYLIILNNFSSKTDSYKQFKSNLLIVSDIDLKKYYEKFLLIIKDNNKLLNNDYTYFKDLEDFNSKDFDLNNDYDDYINKRNFKMKFFTKFINSCFLYDFDKEYEENKDELIQKLSYLDLLNFDDDVFSFNSVPLDSLIESFNLFYSFFEKNDSINNFKFLYTKKEIGDSIEDRFEYFKYISSYCFEHNQYLYDIKNKNELTSRSFIITDFEFQYFFKKYKKTFFQIDNVVLRNQIRRRTINHYLNNLSMPLFFIKLSDYLFFQNKDINFDDLVNYFEKEYIDYDDDFYLTESCKKNILMRLIK